MNNLRVEGEAKFDKESGVHYICGSMVGEELSIRNSNSQQLAGTNICHKYASLGTCQERNAKI